MPHAVQGWFELPLKNRVMLVGVRKNSFQTTSTNYILAFIQSEKTKSGQGVQCCRSNYKTAVRPAALERIEFGGLSLSPYYRPTVGDVRWHGTYRQGKPWDARSERSPT